MKAQLLKRLERLRSSFWFVPSLMAAGATTLAFSTVALDQAGSDRWLMMRSWTYAGGPEGASSVLSTIAGSMITVTGVVFSMTLLALSLTSSQLGPRLLRNFMRDTANQVVLGTFVATFLYCLLVLRTIRRGDGIEFVPHLSVTVGVLFAVVSLGVLIYYIHHISVSIQVDEIVARVGRELESGIDRVFPQQIGHGRPCAESPDVPAAFDREARAIAATEDGYLQLIDSDALMSIATREDVLLRLERRPGHYLVKGRPLASGWPGNRITEEIAESVNAAFVLGNQRTSAQDVGFAVDQLVEIALRALSPGVNDPFTAITCVDRLSSALCLLARREMPSPNRFDDEGRLRVVAPVDTFSALAGSAFDQIRQHSRGNAAVAIRLLEAVAVIATFAHRAADRAVLAHHAGMIARGARDGVREEADRQAVEERFQVAARALAT